MTNPLVAVPADEDAEPMNWEGAGAASSWADLNDALAAEHVDPFQVAFTAAAAGLDTLGAVANPLDSLLAAGVGWLIEHVSFLHEPLDALAGDPQQITAQAQTWHNVAVELQRVAVDYRGQAAALPRWEGAASDAYRAKVGTFTAALDSTAGNAEQLSSLILTTGAGVGTVRALIRDRIAEFLAEVIEWLVVTAAAAFFTAGGSIAVFVASVVVEAIQLATKLARQVSKLLDALQSAGGTAAQLSEAMRDTAAQIRAATPELQAAAGRISDAVDADDLGGLVEAGKQTTAAGQDRRGWEPPAPVAGPG